MVSPNAADGSIPRTDAEHAEELHDKLTQMATDDEDQDQNIARRRSSVVSRPGLSFAGLSAIPPPVPESLPTTPGYELSQRMFENSLISPDRTLPEQQRPPLEKRATATAITKLLHYGEQIPDDIADDIMSIHNPPKNIQRVIAGCAWVFTCGMSDGALGALLPHIEEYYGISYAVVSLLWLGNAVGYISIAFTAHYIDHFLGLQKALTLSVSLFSVMFAVISSGTLFPVLVVGFFFGGVGGAMAVSQYNIFISRLKDGSKYLGIFHGCYGVGAFVSPLLGTAMVNAGVKWHYFYFIPLCLTVCCMVFTPIAFHNCHIDLAKWETTENSTTSQRETAENSTTSQRENTEDIQLTDNNSPDEPVQQEPKHDFKAAMKDYRSWLTCSFIFFYQGSEVSIGGWMVTYLLDYRGGDSKAIGYVASGIWGGVTLGRFLLTHNLTKWFGVRRSIIVLHLMIMALDLMAWLIPHVIVEAVCASLIGLCIGPIYPMLVSLLTRILPRKIRFCAMTLGTAFGSSGGSAVPFCVGMASQFTGTYVLHPIFLVCYACTLISWVSMPNIERPGAHTSLWQKLW